MDDFLHNLRSGKLKQGDRSNRPYDKGGARRNMMDRRKGHYDNNKESSERLNAIKEVLEALTETQKRVAEAYQGNLGLHGQSAVNSHASAPGLRYIASEWQYPKTSSNSGSEE